MSRSMMFVGPALVLALVGSSAQAQPRSGRSPAFDRGVAALEAGRYGDAVGDLEEAVRTDPTPLAIYNLGLAYRGVGRSADAVAAFERYVGAPERRANPAVLAAVRQEIATLRARIATLIVDTDPPDATVTIDGRPASDGRGGVRLDAGAHIIEASAPGRRAQRQSVTLRAGVQERVTIRLVAEVAATNSSVPPPVTATVAADSWGRLIDRGVTEEATSRLER
ncbi:MAG: PEGA domain-containing protein [Deltaproteobacteria bacterium]|nr:PEGA domain-containing protein [Deltaproteobacteria bacterium]